MRRCCCGEDTCTNPTGTHYINVDVLVAANVPTYAFGGYETLYFLEDWDLEFNGPVLVASNSSVRFRAEWHADLRYPDNSVFRQWDRVIDVTLVPEGGVWACGQASAMHCEDCLSKGFFRLDPKVRLPFRFNGNQFGSVTVNAYTNTDFGFPSGSPAWDGVVVGHSTAAIGANNYAMWGRLENGTVVMPSFLSQQTFSYPDQYPAVVYDNGLGYEICTPASHNQIAPAPFSSTEPIVSANLRPSCPSNKAVLEKQGYVFTSYSRTATITT
jgi:hypothetical protein